MKGRTKRRNGRRLRAAAERHRSPSLRAGSRLRLRLARRCAGRPSAEIDRTGHAIDHPIRFPEGACLKYFFATAP
jgi:hypothetical protein